RPMDRPDRRVPAEPRAHPGSHDYDLDGYSRAARRPGLPTRHGCSTGNAAGTTFRSSAPRCAGTRGRRGRPRPASPGRTEPGLAHLAMSTWHLTQLAHQCLTATISLRVSKAGQSYWERTRLAGRNAAMAQ